MGTRGFVGFVADGEMKIGYNHFDSYPDYLGMKVLQWLREADKDHARNLAVYLNMVTDEVPPTDAEIARCVSLDSTETPEAAGKLGDNPSWYWLLRGTQGNPEKILKVGFMEDAANFPHDSLFCEWGYLVDFDEKALEVYKGSQREWHTLGRFYREEDRDQEWKSVALVESYPFDGLPSDGEFLKSMEGVE